MDVHSTMKNILLIIIVLIGLLPLAHAGIVINTESDFINEGETKCIKYGLYNPQEEDNNVALYVSGDLVKISNSFKSDTISVKGNTLHDQAVNSEVCFSTPKNLYEEECILPTIGCKQTCSLGNVKYQGIISAVEEQGEINQGSNVKIAESVPLELIVKCQPSDRNYNTLFIYSFILVVVIIAVTYMRIKKPKQRKR